MQSHDCSQESVGRAYSPQQRLNGIIYYNIGLKCLVRLVVSIYSLKKVYDGSITILTDKNGYRECRKIARHFNIDWKIVKLESNIRNTALLNKCLLHKVTPYDNSIFLDADTVILRRFDELFDIVESKEFVTTQFSNWTTKFKRIRKRINEWKNIFPDDIKPAYNFGPALNTGVFAFRKDSKFMQDWYESALKNVKAFIPDETCCQVILYKYPHRIVDTSYNTSCKFGTINEITKIVHFHGKKHCRLNEKNEFIYNGELWWKYYQECLKNIDWLKNLVQYDKYLIKTESILNEQNSCR